VVMSKDRHNKRRQRPEATHLINQSLKLPFFYLFFIFFIKSLKRGSFNFYFLFIFYFYFIFYFLFFSKIFLDSIYTIINILFGKGVGQLGGVGREGSVGRFIVGQFSSKKSLFWVNFASIPRCIKRECFFRPFFIFL